MPHSAQPSGIYWASNMRGGWEGSNKPRKQCVEAQASSRRLKQQTSPPNEEAQETPHKSRRDSGSHRFAQNPSKGRRRLRFFLLFALHACRRSEGLQSALASNP